MNLKLVDENDPILFNEAEQFDFLNPPFDPVEFAKELYRFMVDSKGLGLAAPQVGYPYKVFAMFAVPGIVCFNPRVIDSTSGEIALEEGCLSYPDITLKVKRPRTIKVRYFQPNGDVVTQKLDGMSARVFLHELDHLNGVTFTRRANKVHVERAFNQRKMKRRFKIPVPV